MNEDPAATPEPIWCVVANVAEETRHGPVGSEIRRGTRHFAPGTKVYCFPPRWGDGYEKVVVLGRHRGARGLAEMVVPSRHLTGWRAKLVYQPHVIARMSGFWDGSELSKRRAESLAQHGRRMRE